MNNLSLPMTQDEFSGSSRRAAKQTRTHAAIAGTKTGQRNYSAQFAPRPPSSGTRVCVGEREMKKRGILVAAIQQQADPTSRSELRYCLQQFGYPAQ